MNDIQTIKIGKKITLIYTLLSRYNIISFIKLVFISFVIEDLDVSSNKEHDYLDFFFEELHKRMITNLEDFKYIVHSAYLLKKANIVSIKENEVILKKSFSINEEKVFEALVIEVNKLSDRDFSRMVVQYA